MDVQDEISRDKGKSKVESSSGRSKSVAHKPKDNYTKQSAKRILQNNQLKGNDDEEGESDESSEGEESEEDKESESDEEANEDDESSEGEESEEESEEELVKNVKSNIVRGNSRKVKKDISESDGSICGKLMCSLLVKSDVVWKNF